MSRKIRRIRIQRRQEALRQSKNLPINAPSLIYHDTTNTHSLIPDNIILIDKHEKNKIIKSDNSDSGKKYCISIVCHNRIEYTRRCIEKLKKYSHNYILLVSDNNSTDGTKEYFNSDDTIFYFQYNKNDGFGKRHNQAFEYSKLHGNSKYFIVLNNDVEVCEGWLEAMEKEFNNPKVALVGIKNTCCSLDSEGNGIFSENIEYAEASCLMVKREYVDILFSEEFKFAYYEDSDLSLRMRERGYEIRLVNIPVIHYRAKTAEIVKEDLEGYKIRNKIIFKNKWQNYLKKRNFEKNILIKRNEAIGDVLLTTPIVKSLKKKYPHSNIYIKTNHPEVFTGNPNVLSASTNEPKLSFDYVYDLDLSYERDPNKHIIQVYSDICGVKPEWSIDIYSEQKYNINEEKKYIVIHAGTTAWQGRNLDIQKFNSVAKELKKMGYKIIIIGNSPNTNIECDYDFRNKTTFYQLSYIIRRAKLFIGIDSMPMHIAQAFKIPLVAVFGCILPEYRLLPDKRFVGLIAKDVGCIGCHHYQSAPRTHSDCLRDKIYCMDAITPEMIIEEAKKLLNN